jgi:hypothetical protein
MLHKLQALHLTGDIDWETVCAPHVDAFQGHYVASIKEPS